MSLAAHAERARNAGRLLIAAGLVCALAAIGALLDGRAQHVETVSGPVFANWSDDSARAAVIAVATREGTLTLRRGPDGWRLDEAGDYFVSQPKLGAVGVALAEMRYLGVKTRNPDKHAALDLGDPASGGSGQRLTVTDRDGVALLDVVIGKPRPEGGYYARLPDDPRTYAVSGARPEIGTVRDWIELDVLQLDRMAIQRVAVDPETGPDYVLARAEPGASDFALVAPETGWSLLTAGAGNATAGALGRLRFEAVEPLSAHADADVFASHLAETSAGASVGLGLFRSEGRVWASIHAEAVSDAAGPSVDAIMARVDGWAFALPDYAAERIARPLAEIAAPTDE